MSKIGQLNTDAFWSMVKRKSISEMLEVVFTAVGEEEAARLAHDTRRMTDLAITKMRDALGEAETEESVDPDINEDEVEHKEPEVDPISATFYKLDKLINKGKWKKAKKVYKDLVAGGMSGSEMDKRKKQIKKGGK